MQYHDDDKKEWKDKTNRRVYAIEMGTMLTHFHYFLHGNLVPDASVTIPFGVDELAVLEAGYSSSFFNVSPEVRPQPDRS